MSADGLFLKIVESFLPKMGASKSKKEVPISTKSVLEKKRLTFPTAPAPNLNKDEISSSSNIAFGSKEKPYLSKKLTAVTIKDFIFAS